ncbi:MAG TPA: hypothetical protein VEV41_05730 [Terriglobales bacterium]|nr:hypothetical protein [Terriglobales bacterium]
MRDTFAVVFLISLVAGSCSAAVCEGKNHPGVTALYLAESTGNNNGAKEWVSDFRELIQKSASYCLVNQEKTAVLVVSMLGRDADVNGISTAISIAVYSAKEGTFLDHWLYISRKDSLQSSAEKAVTALEKEVSELKKLRLVR